MAWIEKRAGGYRVKYCDPLGRQMSKTFAAKEEMTFLTWPQAIELAEGQSERFRAFIYLAVDAGMRWGELIGLQRKNLDFANRRVRVVDQLVRTADGKFHRTEPKRRRRFARSRFRG